MILKPIKNAYMVIRNLFAVMLDNSRMELNRKVTNLSTTRISLALFIIGSLFRWFVGSQYWLFVGSPTITDLSKEVSALIAASGLVAFIWEISIKRTFFNEVMEKVGLATDADKAGLSRITMEFYRDIDWKMFFRNVKNLDILFSYGGTWRSINTLELSEIADRQGVSVRVILPNPTNDALMEQLGQRYNIDKGVMITRVREAENDFYSKFYDHPSSQLTVLYTDIAPIFDFYKFDNVAVITLFSYRKGKNPVPAIIVKRGGTLYKFVEEELKAFVEGPTPLAVPGLAPLVKPIPST